jgi:hypothetical protein
MSNDQKNAQGEFQDCCGGMACGDMMRKMLEAKKSGQPFNCAEMMSQMMQLFRETGEKKERSSRETDENSATKQ